jgi:hypothetical protein
MWVGRAGMRFGITRLDRRTRQAAFLQGMRDQLLEHVGPDATILQRVLVDRAALLSLRLAQCDARILADQPMTVLDNNQIIAWQNALTRCLNALGVKGKRNRVRLPPHLSVLAEIGYANAAE